MKRLLIAAVLSSLCFNAFCWGFYGHKKINFTAVFMLPQEMLLFYKTNIAYIEEHAVDPDKRRYAIKEEGARHYIDIDLYGEYPYNNLPRKWNDAVNKFSEDTLLSRGIVPWHVMNMYNRLKKAFKEKDAHKILKYSAEIAHYISDAHVPLHTSHNHNGQHTNQHGIHGFWESRIPELLAEKQFDFFIGKAQYISDPSDYIWERVLESAAASDSVLRFERELNSNFKNDRKYAFEERNNVIAHQYSEKYTVAYNKLLNGMVERRMRLSIFSTASFWYSAWIDAGQPDLSQLIYNAESDVNEEEPINISGKMIGREE